MADYFIQDDTMKMLSDTAKRISGTENEMTGAEILEVMSRTQGVIKTSGEYKAEVIDYDGTVLKSGNYDTGEIFAMPMPPARDGLVLQDWTCTSPLKSNYVEIESSDVIAGPIYALDDADKDTFMITVNVVEPNTMITISGIGFNTENQNIDFGDGFIGSSDNSFWVKHTYSNIGKYTIKIYDKVSIVYYDGGTDGYQGNICGDSITKPLIESICIPSYITDINKTFFGGLTSLKEVVLHNNISTIRPNVFKECTSLEYAFIPESVTSFGTHIFNYCTNLKKVVLPYGMTDLPDSIFSSCTSLTSIIIPNSVTSIGNYAFAYCDNLTSVIIPNSVTVIEYYAFAASGYSLNNHVETILLPSVTFLGSKCFRYRQFENLILLADEVCATDGDIFYESNFSSLTVSYFITGALYVPDSLVDAYKADSYWGLFSSVIKPYSEYTGGGL